MKISPALLALAAAGVVAFMLFRPRAAAQPPQRGFFDRVLTLGDTVASGLGDFALALAPTHEGVKRTVESGYGDLVGYLRRVDPRPDPLAPGASAIVDPLNFYDPMLDRTNYPALGAALYRWGPGEGW